MATTIAQPPGTFCWPELCSGSAQDSKRFYSSLLGWKSNDMHMPEGDYTIFKLGDESVGAMYQMKEERKKAGVVPHWNSYVAVSNADETAKKAASLGGKVLMEPVEADGNRMANLQDPTGANFSIWQATKPSEAMRLNEVGALCWTELYTRDPEKASAFYSALFGWRPKPWDGGPMPYTMFSIPGQEREAGGMLTMPAEMPGQAHWLPYFHVKDADKSAKQVQDLGGRITHSAMDISTIGRIVMVADSQGAEFAMIKPTSTA
jgi:predicted enzyme related to lactoylglutathione lyase